MIAACPATTHLKRILLNFECVFRSTKAPKRSVQRSPPHTHEAWTALLAQHPRPLSGESCDGGGGGGDTELVGVAVVDVNGSGGGGGPEDEGVGSKVVCWRKSCLAITFSSSSINL